MDPISTAVVQLLATEISRRAISSMSAKGSKILKFLHDYFKDNPKVTEHIGNFEEKPLVWIAVVEEDIHNAIQNSPELKRNLQALLDIPASKPMSINQSGTNNQQFIQQGTQNRAAGGNIYEKPVTIIQSPTILGIPVAAFTLIGSGITLFAFFGMPWITMFLSFTGFEMANEYTNPRYSTDPVPFEFYSFWLIPIAGIIILFISLAELNNKKSINPVAWVLGLMVSLGSLYPFYLLYFGFSSGLDQIGLTGLNSSIIASGFWIALVGNIIMAIGSGWGLFNNKL